MKNGKKQGVELAQAQVLRQDLRLFSVLASPEEDFLRQAAELEADPLFIRLSTPGPDGTAPVGAIITESSEESASSSPAALDEKPHLESSRDTSSASPGLTPGALACFSMRMFFWIGFWLQKYATSSPAPSGKR